MRIVYRIADGKILAFEEMADPDAFIAQYLAPAFYAHADPADIAFSASLFDISFAYIEDSAVVYKVPPDNLAIVIWRRSDNKVMGIAQRTNAPNWINQNLGTLGDYLFDLERTMTNADRLITIDSVRVVTTAALIDVQYIEQPAPPPPPALFTLQDLIINASEYYQSLRSAGTIRHQAIDYLASDAAMLYHDHQRTR